MHRKLEKHCVASLAVINMFIMISYWNQAVP